ncbi:molecular chaperone GrpE [Streptomyces sp. NRRL F-4489]|uniref:nucleotide exchange factor GrpE n=1 Tax=Streptomyces sp. NRRL F-4489 TaxID=1609095 RepID=UPI0007495A6F|nr:nucleotide exchange factor GrpE [Streptomyces sp. NRRL F-4489]KUL37921.1 molecular chaperone GrpE [Streptomyces sp. NRRL F-4489]
MNRPTDRGPLPRPPLALVGRGGPERGPAPPPPQPSPPRERHTGEPGTAPPRAPAGEPGGGPRKGPDTARLEAELRERTADLQRLKAEFDNYRRRVHRDRLAVGQIAVVNVLERLLPVLDAIAEAGAQGEVTGGFRRVADLLERELAALGLVPFGTAGDPFDPTVHEAVSYTPPAPTDHITTDERPVCGQILRQGFLVGDRLLRPAQVAVTGEPPPRHETQLP